MRSIAAIGVASVVCSSSFASVTSVTLDDFASGGPGLGFVRQMSATGASVSAGQGSLLAGGAFTYQSDGGAASPGYDASMFSGISFKVSGDLGGGSLNLSLVGADAGFFAMGVVLNGSIGSNGYAWITFNEIDVAAGNDPGSILGFMSTGTGIGALALSLEGGTGSISIDDIEFRTSAVELPAPGALALLGAAGLSARRRRR